MKRLTTPEETNFVRRLCPTGNHFVSLPVVDETDGSVDRVGVLHMGTASLIEFGGIQDELGAETRPPLEPFLRPFVVIGGKKVYPGHGAADQGRLAWQRQAHWLPTGTWTAPDAAFRLRMTLAAPVWRDREGLHSHKGFVFVFVVDSAARPPERVGLDLCWGALVQTVYTSRPVPSEFTVRRDRWTGGPVLEPRSGAGAGPAAMALAFSGGPDDVEWSSRPDPGGVVRLEVSSRLGAATPDDAAATATGGPDAAAPDAPGPATSDVLAAAFYFGVNREGDGARTVAIDLSRWGWDRLLEQSAEALGRLARGAADPALEARLNQNLLFNYFFAAGRTIDTEDLVLVTSRSPLYYVSAAFWARDALLWSFPGLLLVDPALAEQAIGLAFDRYFEHAGIHSLYMDGRLLYPGFELDELAAYPIALQRYIEATGDSQILLRRFLVPKLMRLLARLDDQACPRPGVALYRTFLLPSDDPATYPYVTYDNVMVWRALVALEGIFRIAGLREAERVKSLAAEVRESIRRHCVVDGPRGKMFAWSVDLAGGSEIADEPPGSLELLTYYGFCPRDDEIWLNTVAWLHSRDNPYRYSGVPFPGLGCPHAAHPFVMSLFNALLGGLPDRIEEAAGVLRRAPLDNGLACESFDRRTGEVKTGAAFATCAGFLGYAMHRVLAGGGGAAGDGVAAGGDGRRERP